MFDGELFIIGRIKDLLIVYGRNHSPDDIEATIQEITRGRCAAIAVPDEGTEKLVAIVELKTTVGPATMRWPTLIPSSVKSRRRSQVRTASLSRISLWYRLVRYPSRQAAR